VGRRRALGCRCLCCVENDDSARCCVMTSVRARAVHTRHAAAVGARRPISSDSAHAWLLLVRACVRGGVCVCATLIV
jgi:hypothetical protein